MIRDRIPKTHYETILMQPRQVPFLFTGNLVFKATHDTHKYASDYYAIVGKVYKCRIHPSFVKGKILG